MSCQLPPLLMTLQSWPVMRHAYSLTTDKLSISNKAKIYKVGLAPIWKYWYRRKVTNQQNSCGAVANLA